MRAFYRLTIIDALVGALMAGAPIGLLSGQNPTPAPPSGPGAATPGKAPAASYDPALLHPATLTEHAPPVFQVQFATTQGDFIVTVTRAWAPLGADRFYNLVKHHFYDGASFFRVIKGFVAQFGISPNPDVTAAWKDAYIRDDPVTQSNKRGFVVFAMRGPDTRTTQLFINLTDNKSLDSRGFAPFGQVTSGLAVVDALYNGYGEGGAPGGGPDQGEMQRLGKPYIDKGWPKLDSIKKARLLVTASPSPAAGAPAPAPKN